VDKSHVHKLIGSLKELFRVGERTCNVWYMSRENRIPPHVYHVAYLLSVHGNSMATCADNLVKFGTPSEVLDAVTCLAFPCSSLQLLLQIFA